MLKLNRSSKASLRTERDQQDGRKRQEEGQSTEGSDERTTVRKHPSFSSNTAFSSFSGSDRGDGASDSSAILLDDESSVIHGGNQKEREDTQQPLSQGESDHPLPSHPLDAASSRQRAERVEESGKGESADMAIHGLRSSPSSSEMLGAGHEDDNNIALSSSPSKRGSRLGATLQKLHFRSSSSTAQHTGDAGRPSFDRLKNSSDGHGDRTPRKHPAGKTGSGKHTPISKDATGDFAHFLEAEELKDALAREKEEEIKRELKATKAIRKHKDHSGQFAGHGVGGRGKPESPEERWQRAHKNDVRNEAFAPGLPTLEQRGYFPGDLRHHGHLEVHKRKPARPPLSQQNSYGSRNAAEVRRIRPPGFCGPVSDSSEEHDKPMPGQASGIVKSRSRRGSETSLSSVASGSSTIAEPHDATSAGQDISSSVISLKSYDSEQTTHSSLISGGANPKLAKPLLELEELELDSFLKNFGRHTREVRVGHSANFPRRRMPQWKDFKVPPGEAELAAAQGKRVTVLTHVDRGLRVLEEMEGEGGPRPRGADDPIGQNKSADKKRGKYCKTTSASNSEAEDTVAKPPASNFKTSNAGANSSEDASNRPNTNSAASSPQQQRISWAPDIGKDRHKERDESKSSLQLPRRTESPTIPLASLRKSDLEKDERVAKQQEQEGQSADTLVASWVKEKDAVYDIHDENIEYRPSRDESGLNDDEWELLHAPHGEEDVEADDDSQVDGVAWAIAYILATIERHAPEELDNSPDQKYRESKTRSHIERLYLIAPFWERLLFGIRRVYRWDNPRRTSSFMMAYFVLWYMNLLITAFMLVLMFYICQFRFFPPDASFLHEQVRARMARGVDADRLAERLRRRSRLDVLELYKRFVAAYGSAAQLACGDVADFHEKVKNLILWRDVRATWRTLTLMGIATIFVTVAPAAVVSKTISGFLGFTFFILLPLQSHYPRFRRPLSPIWWLLWGAPTDQQFAIQILRRRHLERQRLKHPPNAASNLKGAAAKENHPLNMTSSQAKGESSAGGVASNLKNRFLQRSSAAHAVAFGALRPFRSGTGDSATSAGEKLLDLQTMKVLKDGEVEARPRKLGSFFCQHHGVPGHLNVTTRMLYFVALHSHATPGHGKSGSKTCKTPLHDISGIVKTKSLKLLVWNSSGLQVLRRHKPSLFFSNMPHRDNAFNLLLAVGSEVWHEHE